MWEALRLNLTWLGDLAILGYLVVLGVLCVYGLHRCGLIFLFYRHRSDAHEPATRFDKLPSVTVQIPMYNEPMVARRVVEAAANIDYPADRLEIQILDDSTDETTGIVAGCVERIRARGVNIQHIRRPTREGYKAGALAAGLNVAKGEFLAIFDADFVPPPSILHDTIHHFTDPQVGMVQTRWEHLNRDESLLTRAQAVLLDGHFVIEHTARNRSGRFMSFNGTAGIWRRTAIEDAGGWQHDTLTEDLDLSYRAQLRGWKFVFLPQVTSPAELPPAMAAFKAQQHRWAKGGMQTCVKLLPQVLSGSAEWKVKLEAFFHLTSGVVYVLMVLLSLLIGPALLASISRDTQSMPRVAVDFVLFTIGTGSALGFYLCSQHELRRQWRSSWRTIPSLMAIGAGIAFNNAWAALEGLVSRSGEFVRTPKYGEGSRAAPRAAARLKWRDWVRATLEIIFGLYVFACLIVLLTHDNWIARASAAVPFMGLFIFGYLYVGVGTLLGRRGSPDAPALSGPTG